MKPTPTTETREPVTTEDRPLTSVQRTLLLKVAEGAIRFGSARPDLDRAAAEHVARTCARYTAADFYVLAHPADRDPVTWGAEHPAWLALTHRGLIEVPARDYDDAGWQATVTITDKGREALA